MSGFYNIFFDRNPHSKEILEALGLEESLIERYRDCGVSWSGKYVWIYTRTGGKQNRHGYPNKVLRENKYFQRSEDDTFDRTYAIFYFAIPEELNKTIPLKEKPDWAAFFEKLRSDPAFEEQCFRRFAEKGSQHLIITKEGRR